MTKQSRFKRGDRVKYITGNYGDTDSNPLWGGIRGKIGGTVVNIPCLDDPDLRVNWDNHLTNTYQDPDLSLISQEWDD